MEIKKTTLLEGETCKTGHCCKHHKCFAIALIVMVIVGAFAVGVAVGHEGGRDGGRGYGKGGCAFNNAFRKNGRGVERNEARTGNISEQNEARSKNEVKDSTNTVQSFNESTTTVK